MTHYGVVVGDQERHKEAAERDRENGTQRKGWKEGVGGESRWERSEGMDGYEEEEEEYL